MANISDGCEEEILSVFRDQLLDLFKEIRNNFLFKISTMESLAEENEALKIREYDLKSDLEAANEKINELHALMEIQFLKENEIENEKEKLEKLKCDLGSREEEMEKMIIKHQQEIHRIKANGENNLKSLTSKYQEKISEMNEELTRLKKIPPPHSVEFFKKKISSMQKFCQQYHQTTTEKNKITRNTNDISGGGNIKKLPTVTPTKSCLTSSNISSSTSSLSSVKKVSFGADKTINIPSVKKINESVSIGKITSTTTNRRSDPKFHFKPYVDKKGNNNKTLSDNKNNNLSMSDKKNGVLKRKLFSSSSQPKEF